MVIGEDLLRALLHHLLGDRVVDKLPLVVMILLLVDHNGLLGAVGREAHDGSPAEGLAVQAGGRRASGGGWERSAGRRCCITARVWANWTAVCTAAGRGAGCD